MARSFGEQIAGWGAALAVLLAGLLVVRTTVMGSTISVPTALPSLEPLQIVAIVLFFGVALYVVASSGSEISIPFVWSGFILLAAAWALLPGGIKSMLPFGKLIPTGFDTATFAILGALSIVSFYIVSRRAGDGAQTASTAVERTRRDLERLGEEWSTITLYVITGTVAFFATWLGIAGPLAGELFNQFAQAPVVLGDLVTIGLGYLVIVGDVPITGRQFVLAAAAILALVLGVKYGD